VSKLDQAQGIERQRQTLSLIEIEKGITINNAVAPETRSFNQLIHKDGVDRISLLMTIATYIKINCSVTWNIERNLTPEQCVTVASQILDLQHLTFEDVICMMKKAKKGEYGTIYNRIDAGVVMEWVYAYEQERFEAYEQVRVSDRSGSDYTERTNNVPGMVNFEKHAAQFKRSKPADEKYFKNKEQENF
jgi:hypothetical protein